MSLLRKLERIECEVLTRPMATDIQLLFKIKTKLDIFDDFEKKKVLILNSITKWKRIHPLLNCVITKRDGDYHFYQLDKNDETNGNNANITFLKSTTTTKEIDALKLLSIHEINIPIEFERELLWKLIFIQSSQSERDFYLIFNINHAITDGVNMIYILNQLLNLIEIEMKSAERISEINRDYKSVVLPGINSFLSEKVEFTYKTIRIPDIFFNSDYNSNVINGIDNSKDEIIFQNLEQSKPSFSLKQLKKSTEKSKFFQF
jgi:hypothetical protein